MKKSEKPKQVKFDAEDEEWLSEFTGKSRGLVKEVDVIRFAVRLLRNEVDSGADILLTGTNGLQLVRREKPEKK